MSGVTKHIYDHEIRDIISMWNMQLKSIQELLPKGYKNEEVQGFIKKMVDEKYSTDLIKTKYDI